MLQYGSLHEEAAVNICTATGDRLSCCPAPTSFRGLGQACAAKGHMGGPSPSTR